MSKTAEPAVVGPAAMESPVAKLDDAFSDLAKFVQGIHASIKDVTQNLERLKASFGGSVMTKKNGQVKSRRGRKAKKGASRANGSKGETAKDIITSYLQKHGKAEASAVKSHFESLGRSNPAPILQAMYNAKEIKRIDRGVYALA